MELKDLMSGIAVVIDDALGVDANGKDTTEVSQDRIVKIVDRFEEDWQVPFYKASEIPAEETWPNLLQAATFILLDWKLWPDGATELEREIVGTLIRFLKQAKDYFVPVFIFTNESRDDVIDKLPEDVYRKESPEKNFIFLRRKDELLQGDSLVVDEIENWFKNNASVYALKTWERAFHAAKKDLFGSMYARNADWPRVFWNAYKEDRADPNSALTNLINDNLRGRMQSGAFENEILGRPQTSPSREDLQRVIGEVSFRRQETLPEDEIRCGDLFQMTSKKFLLNLRPDCDCIPRNGLAMDIELYCIEGKKMSASELSNDFSKGHFEERVFQAVAFSIFDRKSVRFNYKKLCVKKYSELKDKRIGRLLHPYLTRVQQRYALYMQRQALPRIPQEAVPARPESGCSPGTQRVVA